MSLKSELVNACQKVYNNGFVAAYDGNLSLRLNDKEILITPSATCKGEVSEELLLVIDLDGNIIEGTLKPSSDTPTHLELYRNFESIGGICHAHPVGATTWAQACKGIPCFGTTGADYFYGAVPVTDVMTEDEIQSDYELNTGKCIVRRFAGMDPMAMPAVLVANHGPFTWGKSASASVETMVVLEQTAAMALGTITINPQQGPISQALLDKHYLRKHGKNAYYGQL